MAATKIVSEGQVKVTKTIIEKAWGRRAKGQRIIIRDDDTAGLALVVNATTMTWVFSYRPRGQDPVTKRRWPNKTVTLGNPSNLSVDDARHAAAALKGLAAAGGDPHAERKANRAKAAAERATTTGRLLDAYAKALPLRPKLRGTPGLPSAEHVADEIAHTRAAAAAMEVDALPAAVIDASRIRRLLTSEAARPATARARFGAFSRFMDWAQEEGAVSVNPCVEIGRNRRPQPAPARAHYLTTAQLATLWKSAEELEATYRDLVRFLIAMPCRRGEAAALYWSHVDLDGAIWSQPSHLTKNNEAHRLHLHPLARSILVGRHKGSKKPRAGLVFPAPRSGKPIDTFSDIATSLTTKSGLTGWRWHDFRRSFVTCLGEAGLPEPVLDACLNHRQSATRGGVLGVYQRAQRWPEQVRAMTVWGDALRTAIEGSMPQANPSDLGQPND